jgi:hypothetical protein
VSCSWAEVRLGALQMALCASLFAMALCASLCACITNCGTASVSSNDTPCFCALDLNNVCNTVYMLLCILASRRLWSFMIVASACSIAILQRPTPRLRPLVVVQLLPSARHWHRLVHRMLALACQPHLAQRKWLTGFGAQCTACVHHLLSQH